MSNNDLKNMRQLDEAAEKAGGFVAFAQDSNIQYDMRKIIDYCKKKNIQPVDMTIRELNTFIIN